MPPAKPHEGRLGRGANVVFDPKQTLRLFNPRSPGVAAIDVRFPAVGYLLSRRQRWMLLHAA